MIRRHFAVLGLLSRDSYLIELCLLDHCHCIQQPDRNCVYDDFTVIDHLTNDQIVTFVDAGRALHSF
jgi:hypothetical protein